MTQDPLNQELRQGLEHHQAGRLYEAEQSYRQILARQPNHAAALHYLGVIAHQSGKPKTAVDLFSRAVAVSPNWPEAQLRRGALIGEGILHGNSVWNIQDQSAVQWRLGVSADFKTWHVLSGGVQYGTREKLLQLCRHMCQPLPGPVVCTDQAALNYLYHTKLKNEPGFIAITPDTNAFCATGGPIDDGGAIEGYELQWNGKQAVSPRVGVYQIVHQWNRLGFALLVVEAHRLE